MLNELWNLDFYTNEERRVATYAGGDKPTVPNSVTHETPLSQLNLNWREKDLPERERTKHVHRLHPYLGKYIPQLVEIFLRKYFDQGQTVFDPFSGSGTSLVQANELGIHSVGCDISAFNVMLAKAKTKSYSLGLVKNEITNILDRVENTLNKENNQYGFEFENIDISKDFFTHSEYLKTWFAPQALLELLTFRNFISEYDNQELLKIILSRAARSARLTTHYDLDFPKKPQTEPYHCYKHRRICQPTKTAIQFLKRYGLDTIKRIEEFALLRTSATVNVIHGDSQMVNPGAIDGIITSPPYVGLIDYHEQHRYAYELLDIEDRSNEEIGPASRGSSLKSKKNYQEMIINVFTNAMKHMNSGGVMIVVAGDKYELYQDIAEQCDVHQEAVLKRHVNRRTGMRANEFYESVFIWKKR